MIVEDLICNVLIAIFIDFQIRTSVGKRTSLDASTSGTLGSGVVWMYSKVHYYTYTSGGDGFAASLEYQVITIHCLQPAPSESFSLSFRGSKRCRKQGCVYMISDEQKKSDQ